MKNLAHAYATPAADRPLAPSSIERREPGAGDVAIDILHCGVCHSDLHTARNDWGGTVYPCVPGHEIVGRVRAVGAAVSRFKAGDLVGVGCMVDSCQHCQPCFTGLEQFCDNGFTDTYNGKAQRTPENTYGGYTAQLIVREKVWLRAPHAPEQPAAGGALLFAG